MVWTGLACLNQFINSVVWTGNAINWAPVWCDICESQFLDTIYVSNNASQPTATKFIVGVSIGIPAASLCINRRLYRIACIRVVAATKADKRRAILVDLAIGLGLPILVMILRMFLYFPHNYFHIS